MTEIRWQRRGLIQVPIIEPEPVKARCKVCGEISPVQVCRPCRDSTRQRVHGSHAGYAQHARRFEDPCQECADAERVYNSEKRWGQRHRLSEEDRRWCERNAVKFSWMVDTKTNRRMLDSLTTT